MRQDETSTENESNLRAVFRTGCKGLSVCAACFSQGTFERPWRWPSPCRLWCSSQKTEGQGRSREAPASDPVFAVALPAGVSWDVPDVGARPG